MILSLLLLAIAPQTPAAPPYTPQQVLDYYTAKNRDYGCGIVRVGQAGQVLWEGASGMAERGGGPAAADTLFEIASTSKAITAAAVLLEVEAGHLDLDLPISTWLDPQVTTGLLVIHGHDYGPELTLRQCLGHTSGLPDYWYDPPYVLPGFNAFLVDYSAAPQRFWTPLEVLSYVPALDPIFVPGTGWHYSDSGYLLAGLILEKVTGKTLPEIYRSHIFQPLGMNETWLQWRDPIPPGRQMSHRYEGTWDMTTKRHNSADWAGGGLGSSATDLAKFLRGIADGTLFADPATRDQMMTWTPTGVPGVEYGLGLYHVDLGLGLGTVWGHDGYGNAWMYYWPRQDVTFTGTLNQTEADLWPMLTLAALAIEYW